MFHLQNCAYRKGVLLAVVSAIALGLAGCGDQVTLEAKQEAVKLTLEQEAVKPTLEQENAALLIKAGAGDAEAQARVGSLFEQGLSDGFPKNFQKAAEWYEKAAAQGHPIAQLNLGMMYAYGKGVMMDPAKAVELIVKSAEKGEPAGQIALGKMYIDGKGVGKDVAKGIDWLNRAAAQGSSKAQFQLAYLYHIGEVVPKNITKSLHWYQKAAEAGHSTAQNNLMILYYLGEGVPKNMQKAFELAQKAAIDGVGSSQAYLAWAYWNGEGVSADRVLGYAWANIAAATSDHEIVDERERYDQVMSRSEKVEAQRFSIVGVRESYEKVMSRSEKVEAQRLSLNWRKGQLLVRENHPSNSTAKTSATNGNLTKMATGTAFIVGKSGEAITSYHIIDECKEVRAYGRDGVVKVITSDAINDLALIQLPGAVNATAAIDTEPSKLRQGEDVVVFGFPLNAVLSSGGNLTQGVVSALTGLGNNTNQIQITAPIQPGSSGSPVLNKKGDVVGVVSMKLSDAKMIKATGSVSQNVNFAVSGQTLKSFLDTHKVEFRKSGFMSFEKGTTDLADEARKWTTVVECWK